MADHCGYVVEVKDIRAHSNADRLRVVTFFGNDTCVSADVNIGDIGIYFPSDLQLSEEFCDYNHMCRKKADGTDDTGYLERSKRNIKTIKLRGEYSDGVYCPLSSIAYTGVNIDNIQVGMRIDVINGHEICKKYIPNVNRSSVGGCDSSKKMSKKNPEFTTPFFAEHIDTPQLQYCENIFKPGDIVCITEKVHGTSSRNANTLTRRYKKNLFHRLFRMKGNEVSEYQYVAGTRRTTVDIQRTDANNYRVKWANKFLGKLHYGEEVFGEIAGFTDDNKPIMGSVSNKKVNDKTFLSIYGDTTTFSYGCEVGNGKLPQNRYFIYRMTYTLPDGMVIEYPWDLVKLRAEQMGFETVPELERFIYTDHEDMMCRINAWLDIPSTIDCKHVIEGVVLRALNSPDSYKVAKIKSRNFKIIEGIIKDESIIPDIEEAEEILLNDK